MSNKAAFILGFLDGLHGQPERTAREAEERYPTLTTWELTTCYHNGWIDGSANDFFRLNRILGDDPAPAFDEAKAIITTQEASIHA